jgi:type IV secretory pathway VirB3-like protein
VRPLIALQALRLKGIAIIGIARVASLKGVAIIRTARAVATSLVTLIASVATANLILLLLVLPFNSAISSITQTDARSLSSL